jgi:hypothetical protein
MQQTRQRGRHAALVFWGREVGSGLWSGTRLTLAAWRGGGPQQLTANTRRGAWHAGMAQDARFALRALHRSPTYAWTVVVVMAVGIGACTAIFSAFNAYFFRPLPFADPDQDACKTRGQLAYHLFVKNVAYLKVLFHPTSFLDFPAFYTPGVTTLCQQVCQFLGDLT